MTGMMMTMMMMTTGMTGMKGTMTIGMIGMMMIIGDITNIKTQRKSNLKYQQIPLYQKIRKTSIKLK
jgi:hypothetical protein